MYSLEQCRILGLLVMFRNIHLADISFYLDARMDDILTYCRSLRGYGFLKLHENSASITEAGIRACLGDLAFSGRRWFILVVDPSGALREMDFVNVRGQAYVTPFTLQMLELIKPLYREIFVVSSKACSIWIRMAEDRMPYRRIIDVMRTIEDIQDKLSRLSYPRSSRYVKAIISRLNRCRRELEKAARIAKLDFRLVGLNRSFSRDPLSYSRELYGVALSCRDKVLRSAEGLR